MDALFLAIIRIKWQELQVVLIISVIFNSNKLKGWDLLGQFEKSQKNVNRYQHSSFIKEKLGRVRAL